MNLSGGSGLLTLLAAESELEAPAELCARLEEARARIDGSFIIETLDYLHSGGRCSALSLLGANALRLRPQIVVEDGTMHVGKKYRGNYKACVFRFIDDKLRDIEQYDPERMFITHTITDRQLLQEAKAYCQQRSYFRQIIEHPASAGIACHCGPNAFGLFFLKKG